MRRALDLLYAATGVLAAAATVLIAVVVFVQVGGRLLGYGIRGADDLVAWLTAWASIGGIGYAFTRGAHVKVDLLVDRLPARMRRAAQVASLLVAFAIASYAAYACCLMVLDSMRIDEVSQGDFPVKLWIPQLGIALGTVTLAVAVADALVQQWSGVRLESAAGQMQEI